MTQNALKVEWEELGLDIPTKLRELVSAHQFHTCKANMIRIREKLCKEDRIQIDIFKKFFAIPFK